jgi:nitrogen fixation protein NifX
MSCGNCGCSKEENAMSEEDDDLPISQEVALRIGLAAGVLPNVSVGDLLEALCAMLGDTIDEEALNRITVTNLKEGLKGSYNLDGEEDGTESIRNQDIAAFKEAVRILWGLTDGRWLPDLDAYKDGDMPSSVRVACASNEGEELDGHFGSCLRFLIYQVSADEVRLVDIRPTLYAERSNDRNQYRVNLIKDCQLMYCVSIGGPASAKVIKADIHISQQGDSKPARDVIGALQGVINGNAPPWLKKRLGVADGKRVALYGQDA